MTTACWPGWPMWTSPPSARMPTSRPDRPSRWRLNGWRTAKRRRVRSCSRLIWSREAPRLRRAGDPSTRPPCRRHGACTAAGLPVWASAHVRSARARGSFSSRGGGMSVDQLSPETEALRELSSFPLVEALFGRRSRRFALGDEIPDGPLAYRSRHDPVPLSELERMLLLGAMGGTTGWHFSITRNARYAPHLANYAGAAAGRTFPSAAGFHTSELFYTDDSGLYFFPTRDAGALVDPAVEEVTAELMVDRHRRRIVKLSDERLHIPREEPYLEGHNTWIANEPGSLL